MTDHKPLGEMTEQEWQQHLHERAHEQVDYQMGLESVAMIGFIGSCLTHLAGFGVWGVAFSLLGFLLYLRMMQKVVSGHRYWKLILAALISTLIVIFAAIRLF